MISFAHLPADVLTRASTTASDAVPLLSPDQRRKAARRLAHAVRSGQVPASAVRAALGERKATATADHGFARAAVLSMKAWKRRLAKLPTLPECLAAPFDPSWSDPARKAAAVKWTSALVRQGVLHANEVDACLSTRVGAQRVIDAAIRRAVDAEMTRLASAVGLPAAEAAADPLWAICPAYLTDLDAEACAGAVLYPATPDESFAYNFPLTIDHHGFANVSRAIGALRMQTLFLVAPHEVCTEGFSGSMLYADLESYESEAIDADGNVHLEDDLIEHMMNEYGFDVAGDEETRVRVERMFQFIRMQRTHFAKIGTPAKEIAGIRAAARSAPTPSVRGALETLARLLALAPTRTASSPDIEVESLSEESYLSGALVLSADLAGSEAQVLEDICQINMQVGSSMESLLDGPDLGAVVAVALREIAFTTVLATVLTHYAGAANDLDADPETRTAAA